MMEGSCTRAVDAIADLGDGDLGRVKGFLLQHHAKRCSSCGSYLERMGLVLEGLAGLGRLRPPDDLVEAVMTCLVTEGTGAGAAGPAGKSSRNLVFVVGAAGIGVGAAVGLAIARWVMGREHRESLAPVSSA